MPQMQELAHCIYSTGLRRYYGVAYMCAALRYLRKTASVPQRLRLSPLHVALVLPLCCELSERLDDWRLRK